MIDGFNYDALIILLTVKQYVYNYHDGPGNT